VIDKKILCGRLRGICMRNLVGTNLHNTIKNLKSGREVFFAMNIDIHSWFVTCELTMGWGRIWYVRFPPLRAERAVRDLLNEKFG